jgi:hypothetical protein
VKAMIRTYILLIAVALTIAPVTTALAGVATP